MLPSTALESNDVASLTSSGRLSSDDNATEHPPIPPGQDAVQEKKFSEADMDSIVNLKQCWERFVELDGNRASIESELKKNQVEMWMSGLACCRNELCNAVYECIVPPAEGEQTIKKFYKDPKDCPPGCSCDNPWPFMGNV